MKHIYHTLKWSLFLFLLFICQIGICQTAPRDYPFVEGKIYRVLARPNQKIVGYYLKKSDLTLWIKDLKEEEVEISFVLITDIEEVPFTAIREYWMDNPYPNGYFLGSSAIPLEQGQASLQNSAIILSGVKGGITDFFAVELGALIISKNSLSKHFPIYLYPKVSQKIANNWHIGGGFLYVNFPEEDFFAQEVKWRIFNGMATYGTLDDNITIGLGYGSFHRQFSKKPMLTFSGMLRLSNGVSIITENWFVPTPDKEKAYYPFYSLGLRVIIKDIGINFFLVTNEEIRDTPIPFTDVYLKAFPVLSVTYQL
jgi:hypothetical protein